MDGFAVARERMVRDQLEGRGIASSQVLDAFRRVERHRFVPEALHFLAYDDTALEVGLGQTISQPWIVAAMTEALALPAGARVLDVGTGSGYQAAILCAMGMEVYTIERIAALAEAAHRRLEEQGWRVRLRVGDGTRGWPEAAPFAGIVVAAATSEVPLELLQQLGEGGRLVIPIGPQEVQDLILFTKARGRVERTTICRCRFVQLIHDEER